MNPLHIYVLDRGFVLLGRARPHDSGDDFSTFLLDNCAVVRIWGTTDGLGQLAKDGPTKDTKLDREGDGIELTKKFIIRRIPCTGDWSKTWK